MDLYYLGYKMIIIIIIIIILILYYTILQQFARSVCSPSS